MLRSLLVLALFTDALMCNGAFTQAAWRQAGVQIDRLHTIALANRPIASQVR